MYYSYKEIKTTGALGTTKTFNPAYNYEVTGDVETDQAATEALEQQWEACKYLGQYEGLHYYYVPDDYPLVEQDAAIEATQLATLDATLRANIILSAGSIVNTNDYVSSAALMPYKTSAEDQANWAYLYSMIRGLAYKMYLLLAQTPVSLSSEAVSSVFASNILNKLVEEEINKQNDVNVITDFEVSKRNKLKELELITAKFEDGINKQLYFTSSLGFRCNGDRRTATNIAGLITAYDLPPNSGALVTYRDYDNGTHQLNKEQLQTLYLEHLDNGNMLYQQKWAMEAQIDAAETLDDLKALDLTFKMQDFSQPALSVQKSPTTLKSLLNLV